MMPSTEAKAVFCVTYVGRIKTAEKVHRVKEATNVDCIMVTRRYVPFSELMHIDVCVSLEGLGHYLGTCRMCQVHCISEHPQFDYLIKHAEFLRSIYIYFPNYNVFGSHTGWTSWQ